MALLQGVPDDRRSKLEVRLAPQGPGRIRHARGGALRQGGGSHVAARAFRSGTGSGAEIAELPRPDRSCHQDVRYRFLRPLPGVRRQSRSRCSPARALAGNVLGARRAVDLMNATALKEKIEDAKLRRPCRPRRSPDRRPAATTGTARIARPSGTDVTVDRGESDAFACRYSLPELEPHSSPTGDMPVTGDGLSFLGELFAIHQLRL